jgi:DNA (cytosine-5)-methyltransferase 1
MLRVIREIRPRWIVGENVYGLVNWSGGLVFDTIKFDLEDEGYEIIPVVLPAAGVNAPHNRARIWFIAKDTNKDGWRSEQREGQPCERGQRDTGAGDHERVQADNGETGDAADTISGGQQRQREGERSSHSTGDTKRQASWFNNGDEGNRLPTDWSKFPTQSSVCSRDDGFPTGLDGITFSKWRQESIKAFGNAVVPELVMQIFKTIELYELRS